MEGIFLNFFPSFLLSWFCGLTLLGHLSQELRRLHQNAEAFLERERTFFRYENCARFEALEQNFYAAAAYLRQRGPAPEGLERRLQERIVKLQQLKQERKCGELAKGTRVRRIANPDLDRLWPNWVVSYESLPASIDPLLERKP